jgi:hypothetical protein
MDFSQLAVITGTGVQSDSVALKLQGSLRPVACCTVKARP